MLISMLFLKMLLNLHFFFRCLKLTPTKVLEKKGGGRGKEKMCASIAHCKMYAHDLGRFVTKPKALRAV